MARQRSKERRRQRERCKIDPTYREHVRALRRAREKRRNPAYLERKATRRRAREKERSASDPIKVERRLERLMRRDMQEIIRIEREKQRQEQRGIRAAQHAEEEARRAAYLRRKDERRKLIAKLGRVDYEKLKAREYSEKVMRERGDDIRAKRRLLMLDPRRQAKKYARDLHRHIRYAALFNALRELGWLRDNEIILDEETRNARSARP
jgi:hypothetical protein